MVLLADSLAKLEIAKAVLQLLEPDAQIVLQQGYVGDYVLGSLSMFEGVSLEGAQYTGIVCEINKPLPQQCVINR